MKNLIRDALACKGWTQKRLANETGCTESAVSRYLNGYRKPRIDMLIKICEALDLDIMEAINDIMKGE